MPSEKLTPMVSEMAHPDVTNRVTAFCTSLRTVGAVLGLQMYDTWRND
jgi:hypothetical protein